MNKWELIFLAAIILSLVSVPTEAAEWQWVGENSILRTYVDPGTVVNNSDGSKEVLISNALLSPDCSSDFAQNHNKCINSLVSHTRFFPNQEYCHDLIVLVFTDKTTKGEEFSCSISTVKPGSTLGAVWRYLYR